jgi:hypothetical protein
MPSVKNEIEVGIIVFLVQNGYCSLLAGSGYIPSQRMKATVISRNPSSMVLNSSLSHSKLFGSAGGFRRQAVLLGEAFEKDISDQMRPVAT